jgi:hypothetical protein
MASSTSSPSSASLSARLSRSHTAYQQWLGWQGFTCPLPADWNLASFGGDAKKGTLRVDDGDGPRIELRWETPEKPIDLHKSIVTFLTRLERAAKKKKQAFEAADSPLIVAKSRKPKAQLVNFGWTSDGSEPLAAHGWGTAWQCAECGRVVVAHLIGRASEKPRTAQLKATEIFTALECHGQGGWQAWSVFGLRAEIPNEFVLQRARLQTGKLEIEWQRPLPPGPKNWGVRPERIVLRRIAAANVLLEHETLGEWAQRTLTGPDKRSRFLPPLEITVGGHEGLLFAGSPKSVKQWLWHQLRLRLRLDAPPVEMRLWHDKGANKIVALETELSSANEHVPQDVLDSLDYE